MDFRYFSDQTVGLIIILNGFAIPSNGQIQVASFAQVIVQFTDGSNANIQSNVYNTDFPVNTQ